MLLISFDVGIHNMAYCLFEWSETDQKVLKVVDWKVISLLDTQDTFQSKCNYSIQPKKKSKSPLSSLNEPPKMCGNKAIYKKNAHFYCNKHATMCEYIIPKKEYTPAHFKKMKKEDLITYKINHFIPVPENITTKPDLVNAIVNYYSTKLLEPAEIKRENAGEANLIRIGVNMKTRLDSIEHIQDITHVIIENQISPIATRMKTIQGMLAQYFIMKCNSTTQIEFISSLNKLKGFETTTPNVGSSLSKSNYKAHKKDSVRICMDILDKCENGNGNTRIISKNEGFQLKEMLLKPKKDDYADAFLQGIWYLKNKKIFDISLENST